MFFVTRAASAAQLVAKLFGIRQDLPTCWRRLGSSFIAALVHDALEEVHALLPGGLADLLDGTALPPRLGIGSPNPAKQPSLLHTVHDRISHALGSLKVSMPSSFPVSLLAQWAHPPCLEEVVVWEINP